MRRSSGRLLTLLTAVGLGLLLAVGPAGATTPRPDHDLVGPVERADPGPGVSPARQQVGGSVTLKGRGNGHGRGLSQYGAKGAAQDGWSYRRITGFYYPGTTWDTARGRMQVLITADTSPDLVVQDREGLRARSVGGSWVPAHQQRPGATQWRISADGRERSVLSSRSGDGAWRTLRRFDGEAELSAGRAPLRLVTPAGTTAYAGTLRSVLPPAAQDDPRDTVNVVPMETYLRGVVPREVPASWPVHAVRAQAVAARSYAAYERAHPRNVHYQVLDTAGSQVYGGVAAQHPDSDAAVRATRGEVRFADGRPAFTQFSASNGGWTARGSFSYLPARRDRNEQGSGNPYATWRRSVSHAAIESAWPGVGRFSDLDLLDRDGHGQWDGRVGRVRISGSGGSTTVSGETFRLTLGLPSTWFTRA